MHTLSGNKWQRRRTDIPRRGTGLSKRFEEIRRLVHKGAVRISERGYHELSAVAILAREVVAGVADAIVVEDYPEYPK